MAGSRRSREASCLERGVHLAFKRTGFKDKDTFLHNRSFRYVSPAQNYATSVDIAVSDAGPVGIDMVQFSDPESLISELPDMIGVVVIAAPFACKIGKGKGGNGK